MSQLDAAGGPQPASADVPFGAAAAHSQSQAALNESLENMTLDRETADDNFLPEEVAVSDKWRSQFRGHIFNRKESAGHLSSWFMQNRELMNVQGVPEKWRGCLLLTLLTPADHSLVASILGISETVSADPQVHTYQVVADAIRRAVSAAEDTDQGLLYQLSAYKLDTSKPQPLRSAFQSMEQIILKFAETPNLQTKIFFFSQKVPQLYRDKFQFHSGMSWSSWDAFKTNWMAQAALVEQTIAKQAQKDKQGKQSDKTGNWRKKQRYSPYKRTQSDQQQPKQSSKQQRGPARPCKHCGGNHYDNQCNKVQNPKPQGKGAHT